MGNLTSKEELPTIEQTVKQRYRRPVSLLLADVVLRRAPGIFRSQ